jgi:hypothetical protein
MFFKWLYTGLLTDDQETLLNAPNVANSYYALISAYIFGETHGSPSFKNAVIDIMIQLLSIRSIVPKTYTKKAYNHTTKNAELRKLLVAMIYTVNCKPDIVFGCTDAKYYPKEFLFDLCYVFTGSGNTERSYISGQGWQKLNKCIFHDHTDINSRQAVEEGSLATVEPNPAT